MPQQRWADSETEAMSSGRQVVFQHLVFEHRGGGEVFRAFDDLGEASAALALTTAIGDAGADLFRYLDQPGAGRDGDGDADVFKRDLCFGHGVLLERLRAEAHGVTGRCGYRNEVIEGRRPA